MKKTKSRNAKPRSRGVGRPTVMTEAVVGKLHNAFAIGATVEEACRFAGIGKNAFYDHIKKNEGFSNEIEGVKDRPILKSKSLIVKAINDGSVPMAQWYLERKCRKEFSAQRAVDLNVLNGDMILAELDSAKARATAKNRKPEE